MSTKFVIFGSCLSAHVAKRLINSGFELFGVLRQVRSDILVEAIEGKGGFTLTRNDVSEISSYLKNDKKGRKKKKLDFNTKECFRDFTDGLKKADFVLFDNQYDLERSSGEIIFNGTTHIVSNVDLIKDGISFVDNGVIPIDVIAEYRRFYDALLSVNPEIKVFFVQYPIFSGEESGGGRDFRVSRSFATANKRFEWGFSSTPLYKVKEELRDEDNRNHFKSEVYDALSKKVRDFALGESSSTASIEDLECSRNKKSPYSSLPDRQYWKPAVADLYPLAISDLYRKKFNINIEDGVATCGSCFAQHIGKRLDRKGYNYMDVEPVPVELAGENAKSLGYGIYSARYGNVYTSRQLVQLFERAFGKLSFDEVWQNKEGRYVDPFRPNLCGDGYATSEEVLQEQQQHLKQVRRMFETLDVFVYTMGLTETWVNRETGAAYPICPGVTAGTFDPDRYEFVNLDYTTILDEMETFLSYLREVNPSAKVLLTVSPVPLTATAEERHVLLSTMASKSILRSVADQLYRRHAHVDYFPSYDIIMSPPFKSMFFKNNLRSIHEEGVDYVMSHFFAQHQLEGQSAGNLQKSGDSQAPQHVVTTETAEEEDDEAFCDEAFLELERKTNQGQV